MTAACIKAHKSDVSSYTVWNSSINQGSIKTVITVHPNTLLLTPLFVHFHVAI